MAKKKSETEAPNNAGVPDPSAGGKARAKKLTAEQRSAIASKGAAKRWGPPKATHEGELTIGDAVVPCAVLDGGIRVISQRGMSSALGRHVTGSGSSKSKTAAANDGVAKLPIFIAAANLKPFIDIDLAASLAEPVEYRPIHGGRTAYGFKAELFPRICEVWLKAKDAGVLTEQQLNTAEKAYLLMRALAHVAIIALVDEATGFQDVRARDALAKILEAFIAEELRPWAPTFPPTFYKEMFRLKGLKFDGTTKRPKYFGHLTNNLVYSRLAPGVLDELKRKTPKTERGNRKNRYHQWLSDEVGDPKLQEHFTKVVTLMQSCDEWEDFEARLNRVAPKYKSMPLLEGLTDEDFK